VPAHAGLPRDADLRAQLRPMLLYPSYGHMDAAHEPRRCDYLPPVASLMTHWFACSYGVARDQVPA